jgi:hypothetical protein
MSNQITEALNWRYACKKFDPNKKLTEDQLNTIDTYSKQASATISTMQEVLLETIKKGRWIENKRLDKVNDLKLKYTDKLRMDIKTGMREMFNMGKRDASFELKKKIQDRIKHQIDFGNKSVYFLLFNQFRLFVKQWIS